MRARTTAGRLRVWAPVACWAGVILVAMSRSDLGAAQSVANPLTAGLAHLVFYGVLGLLVGRALQAEGLRRPHALGVGLAGCALFGISTEGMQALLTARSATPFDLVLNLTGVGMGLAVAERMRRPRVQESPVAFEDA